MTMPLPKTNNFDLIRPAAALQVALTHALAGLGVAAPSASFGESRFLSGE
jgi:hypothetical protein